MEDEILQERLMNMKKIYTTIGKVIDNIPDTVPSEYKEKIKKLILGDKELEQLMEGIDNHRPPRIFLIGRTGVGKSSLINAILGTYLAKVSDTVSCTTQGEKYSYESNGRILMDIYDTRGIAESETLDRTVSAEDKLVKELNEFSPDVAVFMLNSTHRDDVSEDVEFLKKLTSEYEKINKIKLPIVVVVNKVDEVAPSRHKDPDDYTDAKKRNIDEIVRYYKSIIISKELKVEAVVPVSSLIDWKTPDGLEIPVEDIDKLPTDDISKLQFAFDGRYGIEELKDQLENAILDVDAKMGLRMATRLKDVSKNIANRIISIFTALAAAATLPNIPVADMVILDVLEGIEVSLIAALSGREIDMETAKEFITSVGGIYGAGLVFRKVVPIVSKFLPGGGIANATVASVGAICIGSAAVSYFIDGNDIKKAKKIFNEKKKKLEQKEKNKDDE